MRAPILLASVLLILFASGCIFGGDATNTAQQLAGVRDSYISNGLLAPTSPSAREQYRDEILPFRATINSVPGSEGDALKAYLNGSLSLLAMVQATDDALALIQKINFDAPDCGTNSPLSKSIKLLAEAKTHAESTYEYFSRVQENSSMANELGADYVLNAAETAQGVAQTHAERINELKTVCGLTV